MTHGNAFIDRLPADSMLGSRYRALLEAVNSNTSLPARVKNLCAAKIAQIHGCPVDGVTEEEAVWLRGEAYENFSEAEAAALVLADRMPYQHHEMQDEEVERVRTLLGNPGCVALLTFLAFSDVNCRLDLTVTGGGL